jgi:hypothetical protein
MHVQPFTKRSAFTSAGTNLKHFMLAVQLIPLADRVTQGVAK